MKYSIPLSNSRILMILFMAFFFHQRLIGTEIIPTDSTKIKVIFDTDMGPDYDDIGAIALLHAFADQRKIEILATVASDAHKDIPATIEVYNRYFGRGEIPVGKTTNPTAPEFTAGNNWNDAIIKQFAPELGKKDYPLAVDIYRRELARQPDNSVTIITVGFMTNISDLLKSKPDQYSKLNGVQLVNQKVKNWVAMAAAFPQGKEFNVHQDAGSAIYAFENFPKPILFSGFEIGDRIKTGGKVAGLNKSDSPVSIGYKINLETYEKQKVESRKSWDQTAVLIAAYNPEKYFYISGPGKIRLENDGSNYWEPKENGNHKFIIHKYPYQKLEEIIDELMVHEPQNK